MSFAPPADLPSGDSHRKGAEMDQLGLAILMQWRATTKRKR